MHVYGKPAAPDGGKGTRAGLVLLYSAAFGQFSPAYMLDERDLVIGRDPTANLCIPEGAVSRQHARIRFQGGQWVIADLGSRNGTIVDGELVREVELEPLAEIRVGDAIFKFVEAGAESYARYRIDGEILAAPEASGEERPASNIVGGYQIQRLARSLERVAPSSISVILLGESGTGKEVFARQLHDSSGRQGPFLAINCAAIPAALLESELFGYKRGAFSGADRDKIGLVRAADRGTLLLDEIGDMPPEAQAKLLRVLQTKEVVPLGGTSPERVDVRVVCATHRDLAALQTAGRFRGDLFARLNEYTLRIPPLRERKEDVYMLLRAMLARHGHPRLAVSFAFMTGMLHYDFPFNVRELEGMVKRGVTLCEGDTLDAQHLPDELRELMNHYGRSADDPRRAAHEPTRPPSPPSIAPWSSAAPISAAVSSRGARPSEGDLRGLLATHRGNIAAVGRVLGKERMQLHRWMKRYGINPDEYR